MNNDELYEQIMKHVNLAPNEISELLDIPIRKIYYILSQKDREVHPPPSPEQQEIVDDMWQRGYTMKSISHKLGVTKSVIFSWKQRRLVGLRGRNKPEEGFYKFWCQHPENVGEPGLHQCLGCPAYSYCDERIERSWWLGDSEFMEGKEKTSRGFYVHS